MHRGCKQNQFLWESLDLVNTTLLFMEAIMPVWKTHCWEKSATFEVKQMEDVPLPWWRMKVWDRHAVHRPKEFWGVFSNFPFFFSLLFCVRVRAGEVAEHITTDDSEVRVSTQLWSLFLAQHFQLQNTGQTQGYCCHIYLRGDSHERRGTESTRGTAHTLTISQPIC